MAWTMYYFWYVRKNIFRLTLYYKFNPDVFFQGYADSSL